MRWGGGECGGKGKGRGWGRKIYFMNARLLITAPYRENMMLMTQRGGGGGVEDVGGWGGGGGKWGRVRRQSAHGLPSQTKYYPILIIPTNTQDYHHVVAGPF